ncbi:hypothetical protein HDU99_003292, partial [Rhizoclosmatium hyalinum]
MNIDPPEGPTSTAAAANRAGESTHPYTNPASRGGISKRGGRNRVAARSMDSFLSNKSANIRRTGREMPANIIINQNSHFMAESAKLLAHTVQLMASMGQNLMNEGLPYDKAWDACLKTSSFQLERLLERQREADAIAAATPPLPPPTEENATRYFQPQGGRYSRNHNQGSSSNDTTTRSGRPSNSTNQNPEFIPVNDREDGEILTDAPRSPAQSTHQNLNHSDEPSDEEGNEGLANYPPQEPRDEQSQNPDEAPPEENENENDDEGQEDGEQTPDQGEEPPSNPNNEDRPVYSYRFYGFDVQVDYANLMFLGMEPDWDVQLYAAMFFIAALSLHHSRTGVLPVPTVLSDENF